MLQISKYEIDMLNVGNADAFLIHFFTIENIEYIVLVDGGNYENGKDVVDFIKANYSKQYIDLAICTHCDKDHFGGIMYLLEQMKDDKDFPTYIKELWINDPSKHVKLGEVKWITKKQTLNVKVRSVYDLNSTNLFDILNKLPQVNVYEPFVDADVNNKQRSNFGGIIKVIGPTIDYYSQLVPDFRNDLQRRDDSYDTDDIDPHEVQLENGKEYSKVLKEAKDDPSSHNKSSVIFVFEPIAGKKYLFTGDACRDSIEHLKSHKEWDSLTNISWIKIPHHGSKHNIDNDIIDHLKPSVAYISSEKYTHYLSKAVVAALQKVGTKIYTTNVHGSMCHHHNTKTHDGYSNATPLAKI